MECPKNLKFVKKKSKKNSQICLLPKNQYYIYITSNPVYYVNITDFTSHPVYVVNRSALLDFNSDLWTFLSGYFDNWNPDLQENENENEKKK
ncbi:hypothetical protein M0811_07073 [Anaeramoeba ignava]|uniref:Uncharacterized protein n=1 Tax=Anaeramoeba ignava TaxID=1746090 RepID=A0A9Q0LQ78_ANAIG|nr:hypothetical protein M0811_07073 [Anaeramoeba ignava]